MEKSGDSLIAVFSRIRKSSYVRRVFFSVAAIISAIIIASAVASYLVMRSQIIDAAEAQARRQVQQVADSFATLIASSIIPAAEQVYETRVVDQLIYGSKLTDADMLNATQLLDRFKLANPLISSILIYNHQMGLLYSTADGISSAGAGHYPDLFAIFSRIRNFGLYRLIPRKVDDLNLLTIIVGSPPYSGTSLLGGLVVNVSEQAVRAQISGRLSGGTRLSILDDTGMLLSDTNPALFGSRGLVDPTLSRAFAAAAHLGNSVGSFSVAGKGTTLFVTFYRDPVGGWIFVSQTSGRELLAVISQWRNYIIAIFGIVLLLSLLFALTTSRSVSMPIERLAEQTRMLQSEFSELLPDISNQDEIAQIIDTMQLLNDRLRTLEYSTTSRTDYARRRALARLLRSQELSTEEQEILAATGLGRGEVIVASCTLDDLESVRASRGQGFVNDAVRTMVGRAEELGDGIVATEVANGSVGIVARLPQPGGGGAAGEVRGKLRSLLRTHPAAGEYSATGERSAAGAQASFTLGVSDPVVLVEEIPAAFDTAVEAVHYRFRHGSGTVIGASDIAAEIPAYVLPEDQLRRFVEHARLLDRVLVASIVDALLEGVKPFAYEDFLFLTQNILYSLERVFIESDIVSRRLLADFRARVLNLRWVETTEDVIHMVVEWYTRFCELSAGGYAEKLSSVLADLKKVITDNLFDPELSTKTISARMKLSVNYVRSVFKTATGESIANYVTRLRIERCKELLESTTMSVKEVYVAAGFSNYNYFFTLFKKQTGHTPQEYQRHIAMN